MNCNHIVVGLGNPTSSQISWDTLGWTPSQPGLISDLDNERAFAAAVGAR